MHGTKIETQKWNHGHVTDTQWDTCNGYMSGRREKDAGALEGQKKGAKDGKQRDFRREMGNGQTQGM